MNKPSIIVCIHVFMMLIPCRLEKVLSNFEKKHNISTRWLPTDRQYIETTTLLSEEKQKQLADCLISTSSKRQFLLKLKAKYAGNHNYAKYTAIIIINYYSLLCPYNTDGQKIAKKLSIQITKETKQLQELVQEYNAYLTLCSNTHLQPITDMQEAKDPSMLQSKVTSTAVLHKHHGTLSSAKKLDIINAHLMVARAKEEMLLLKAEMFNTIMYYKNMSDGVEAAIRKLPEEAFQNFTRGCRALLTN